MAPRKASAPFPTSLSPPSITSTAANFVPPVSHVSALSHTPSPAQLAPIPPPLFLFPIPPPTTISSIPGASDGLLVPSAPLAVLPALPAPSVPLISPALPLPLPLNLPPVPLPLYVFPSSLPPMPYGLSPPPTWRQLSQELPVEQRLAPVSAPTPVPFAPLYPVQYSHIQGSLPPPPEDAGNVNSMTQRCPRCR
jgi:hypothetical protein